MNQSLPSVQILVISLARSLDRRIQAEHEMQKISFPWKFLDAIDGAALKAPPIEYQPSKVRRLQGYELTPNEIGCFLSHKEAWKRCLQGGMVTLVLEDDFVLSPHFQELLIALLVDFPQWELLRLQGLYEVPFKIISESFGICLAKNQGDAVGATAYLVKPQAAEVLLRHSTDIYEPVDHFLEHHQKHGLEFLSIRPYPIDITSAKSTIADRSERAPIKGIPKIVRSIARVFDRILSKDPWFPK